MKVVWINPRFLHYRVPVYKALDEMIGNNLTVIFSDDRTPGDVKSMIIKALGKRAVALKGEKILSIGRNDKNLANIGIRIPYQGGLFREISDAKPDIMIAEGFFQWAPAAIWARISKGIPLVVTYERTMHTERNSGMVRKYYRKLVARYVDAICCNGSLSKKYCTEILEVHENQIITGAMAADNDAIAYALNQISEKDIISLKKKLKLVHPVFLYVGRMVHRKGLRELLAAWKIYNEISSTQGSLVLVGDGPERSGLEKIVHEQGLMNVVFAGRVDHDSIVPFYAVCDMFVMPTLEDNWSLAVPEAMACGKPVLCSKYNGCWPELIHERVNGCVFDPFDTAVLAKLLKKYSEHIEQLPAMGLASHKIVQDFSPQKAAEAVFKACNVALNSY